MLEIKLLGQFDTRLDGRSLTLDSRQAQALLAYLALHRDQAHRREKVAGLLWPDTTEKNARNNLRHVIWQINQTLGSKHYLKADRINIQLNADAHVRVDTDALLACKPEYVSTETLTTAAASVQGELLPGFYEEWITPEREAVNVAFERVMSTLLNRLTVERRWRDVVSWAAHWIAKTFAPESAYCALMTAYAELDEAAGLAATYRAYVDGLREQFGTQPSHETVALYHRLRKRLEAKATEHLLADWADAPDARSCFGRETDLSRLRDWFTRDDTRVALVLGLGGIGKTTLTTAAARQLQPHFEGVVWRSLRNAPSPRSLLEDWLHVFAHPSTREPSALTESFEQRLSLLLDTLRARRYLLILDNYESVFESGAGTGAYRDGYAEYGELLRSLVEGMHSSAVILTSREKPDELAASAGDAGPVRILRLGGVDSEVSRDIVQDKSLTGTAREWETLNQAYGGNPLALKIVAEGIRELFNGDIARYLHNRPGTFGTVRRLFDQQFGRLTKAERDILLWLAIERESTTIERLQEALLLPTRQGQVFDAVQSLRERSLIETTATGFTLQNVVMEHVTERLIEMAAAELREGTPNVLRSHALIKAGSTDYVREAQTRLILQPVTDHIEARMPRPQLAQRLAGMLDDERAAQDAQSSYLSGNILNLLARGGEISHYNFADLNVRQAYLRTTRIRDCSFDGARFSHTAFAEQFVGLNAVDISHDGRYIVIATRDEARIWHTAAAQPHVTLRGHTGFVWNAVFSADGDQVATASADGSVRVWDVETGELAQVLTGTMDESGSEGSIPAGADMWGLVFNAEGTLIASGDEGGDIFVWDTRTGRCVRRWHAHSGVVYSLTFDLPSNTLVSGGGDGALRVWQVATADCNAEYRHPSGEVRAVAMARDGTLASAGTDGIVRLWGSKAGAPPTELHDQHAAGADLIIPSIAFSKDGDSLVYACSDGTVRVYDTRQHRAKLSIRAHAQGAHTVGMSADGATIVSIGYDGAVRLWDARSGRAVWTVRGYNQEVRAVAFSPDGQWLISGSADYAVRIWDVAQRRLRRTLHGHRRWVESVAVSPDGERIASGSYDRTLRLWDIHSGQILGSPCPHDRWVWSVAFSPNGRWIATGGADARVRLWESDAAVGVGRAIRRFVGHERGVWRVQFSWDSTLLATASADGTARVWHVDTGECAHVLRCDAGVNSVAFTRDDLLATADDDGMVRLWDARTGAALAHVHVDAAEVASLSFSADGRWLAGAGGDGIVRVWDVGRRELHREFRGHTAASWSVAFHPQSPVIASGSLDGTIRLWNIETGACDATLRADRLYERMSITGATGLTDAERATLLALGAVSA